MRKRQLHRQIAALQAELSACGAQLRGEHEKVEFILQNMAEGFVLVGQQRNIVLCNRSARAMFGLEDSLPPENIYQLTHDQTVLKALRQALEENQSAVFDLELGHRQAEFRITSTALGATMLVVDTTAQQLLQQQKRDFFSNASHELKTPVTSILGFSQLLAAGQVSEPTEVIARIESEAARLSDLISDILTVSRLESNRKQGERVRFSLAELVNEAMQALPAGEIPVQLDLCDVEVHANRRQVFELCTNLLENALRYNKPGGSVTVRVRDDGDYGKLTVQDTGIGIAPQYQARVFERFFRVDYGRDKSRGGTGLGLAIVKHIVNLHGGRISLHSREGRGTTIRVWLPK